MGEPSIKRRMRCWSYYHVYSALSNARLRSQKCCVSCTIHFPFILNLGRLLPPSFLIPTSEGPPRPTDNTLNSFYNSVYILRNDSCRSYRPIYTCAVVGACLIRMCGGFLHNIIVATALRSIILRSSICIRPGSHTQLPNNCLFCLFFIFWEVYRIFRAHTVFCISSITVSSCK